MPNLDRRDFLGTGAWLALAGGKDVSGQAQTQALSPGGDPTSKDLRQSQLFLDDTWIERTARLERCWETPDLLPEPVLRPDAPWEGAQVVMSGSVFKLGNEWRMYYRGYNRPAPTLFCMATSSDGLHWERPKLGLVEYGGSKANNILYASPDGERNDGVTVCHDEQDSSQPFKAMYFNLGGKRPRGEYVAFSKDGIVWRHHPQPVLTNTGDRTFLLSSRDPGGKFVAFLRHKDMTKLDRARTVWRSESDDFLHWSDPRVILKPDRLDDANTELYGMPSFRYADMYLGMLERWYGNPDRIEVQLAWSHDGRVWRRPEQRSAFIGPAFPWNKGWNSCANTPPVRIGNKLWFYFGGRSAAHNREAPESYGAIGLASLRVDGFACLRADFQEGELVTKPMRWPGGDLILNCTNTRNRLGHPTGGGGAISVEVRDEVNQLLEGFSGDRRAQHNHVSPAPWETKLQPVRWPGDRSLNELAGKSIRLVFLMRDARLYSFRSQNLG